MNYRHNPSVVVTDLDDELVLLDPISKHMFSLNMVGRLIWMELPRQGLQAALEQVVQTFDVTPAQAQTDAVALIERLTKSKLIEVIESDALEVM